MTFLTGGEMSSDHQRLILIRDAIDEIERHAAKGKLVFEEDSAVQSELFKSLQEIAEASSTFSDRTRGQHNDVDWTRIESMQSYLNYKDIGIDPEILWLSIEQEIPALKQQVNAIFAKVETQVG
jgi:uncharacterized protein with HEPN domain